MIQNLYQIIRLPCFLQQLSTDKDVMHLSLTCKKMHDTLAQAPLAEVLRCKLFSRTMALLQALPRNRGRQKVIYSTDEIKDFLRNKQIPELLSILHLEDSKVLHQSAPFYYERVTERIQGRADIETMLFPEEAMQELLISMQGENLGASAKIDPQIFAYQALQLFARNDISYKQFASCMFYWALRQQLPVEQIKTTALFQEGSINPLALAIIDATFLSKDQKQSICKGVDAKAVLQAMKAELTSEQHFFVIDAEHMLKNVGTSSPTITQIIQKVGLNVFTQFDMEIEKQFSSRYMVASFSLIQAFLKMYSPNRYVTLLPYVGESPLEYIRDNGLGSTRDMGIPFPGTPLPKVADERFAPHPYNFWMHDFYHAFICSRIPQLHRRHFIKIADALKKRFHQLAPKIDKAAFQVNNQHFDLDRFMNALTSRLIDMEMILYGAHFVAGSTEHSKDRDQKECALFLIEFGRSFDRAFQAGLRNPMSNQESGRLKNTVFNYFEEHMSITKTLPTTLPRIRLVEKLVFEKMLGIPLENNRDDLESRSLCTIF